MSQSSLSTQVTQAWEQVVGQPTPVGWSLKRPESWEFGDFTTNIALVGFTTLTADQKATWSNPRALAQSLAQALQKIVPNAQVVVAGPGFINLTLAAASLCEQVSWLTDAKPSIPSAYAHQTVVVEFTDPNPFKEFHIGHLYSNIVGESLSRLLELGGADVHRVCYQGDVGMHVAKSIWGLQQKLAQDAITSANLAAKPLAERIKYLGQAYALGASAYETDTTAKTAMQDINFLVFIFGQAQLQATMQWQPQVDYRSKLSTTRADESEIEELYTLGRQWSLEYFETIYQRLGTKFEEYFFESLVGELGLQLVRAGQKSGVFQESQGAVIYQGSQKKLHDRVFINSQGLPTYEAKELGLAPEKYRRIPYDCSIIVTGNEINEYFKVLLSALHELKPDLASKTKHVSHGMVRLPDGKMSSRTGKILTGEWLLDEAQQAVMPILQESVRQGKIQLTSEQMSQTAEQISQAAIKFALLSSHLGKDIAFDFETSLNFSGFSGPYLQYTATRCQSLQAKAQELGLFAADTLYQSELTGAETLVLRELSRFEEVIERAINDLAPHVLAEYLFALAQAFNAFYAHEHILQSNKAAWRLALTKQVWERLKLGLSLLGIATPTQM